MFWWRHVEDPYAIFVAEVLLARTRADRVAKVALDFVRTWPDFCSLAKANELDLERALRPLGLQRVRALALKVAAIEVCTRWGGRLPLDEEAIASLPRSGRYVANAVLVYSACSQRVAVDVNVARVLSRFFGIPVAKELHRDENLWDFAQRLVGCISGCEVRNLNWALLDLAREICRPNTPRCTACPLSETCFFSNDPRAHMGGHAP